MIHAGHTAVIWYLLALLPLAAARAGDEEINPSVYQVFDPETGYFIDVEPPPDAQQSAGSQTHTPAAANPTAQQPTADVPVAAAPVAAESSTATSVPDRKPLLIAGIATILVLVAGFALRKKGS